MPTFDDPLADATEASAALRGPAHATRTLSDPADVYSVIGDLLAGVRSLRQVLDQLASAHIVHRARAHDDAGNQLAGASSVLAAADELHQAATLLDAVHDRLDAAMSQSGRIAWHPAPTARQTSPAMDRIAARLGAPRDTGIDPFVADPFRVEPFSRDPHRPHSSRPPSL